MRTGVYPKYVNALAKGICYPGRGILYIPAGERDAEILPIEVPEKGSITLYQHAKYWTSTIARVQTVDFNILHACLPYALAFLEEHQQSDLIPHILNSNYGASCKSLFEVDFLKI